MNRFSEISCTLQNAHFATHALCTLKRGLNRFSEISCTFPTCATHGLCSDDINRVSQLFWTPKLFGPIIFLARHYTIPNLWTTNYYRLNIFRTQTLSLPKTFGTHILWTKHFLDTKFLEPKIFGTQNLFWT